MIHDMNLHSVPFYAIESGQKDIELNEDSIKCCLIK